LNKWANTELKGRTKKEAEVLKISVDEDTLCITSTVNELFHPFGKFNSVAGFEKKYPGLLKKNPEYFSQNTGEIDTLFRMTTSSSYIKMFDIDSTEDEDRRNRMEIISAEINDPEVVFTNGVHVGLKKKRFLENYFTNQKGTDNFSVIELESGVTGIWHYYYFEKGRIKRIKIRTDFTIQ
jgi:hypothetical protein